MSRRNLSERERAAALRQASFTSPTSRGPNRPPRYAVKALSSAEIESELARADSDPGWLAAVQAEAARRGK